MSRRQRLWILLAIFAAMATLQIGLARRQCLWVDEIFSLAIATGHSLEHPAAEAIPALGDFVEPNQPVYPRQLPRYLTHENPPASPAGVFRAVLLSDTSPPLYFLLLYLWTLGLGTSDTALRLFSIAWSLACFPMLADIARRTGGKAAVIPACVLFALSPLGLYFSGEGRMYSLLLFCVVATAWVSLVLHERGGGIAVYALWILASAAGFLTHYFFLFPWAAMVAFLILEPSKFERRRLLLCVFIVGLAILPWYLLVAGSVGHWRITQGWLHMHPTGFNRFRAIRNHFLQFFSSGGSGLWKFERLSSLAAIALFAFVAAAMAWRVGLGMFTGPRLLLTLWFIIVCAAPTVMDLLQHTYITNNPRYTLAALPAAYLLAAIGLCSLRQRTAFIVLLLILLSWIMPIANIYRQRWRSGEPFRDVAREMSASGSASNLILIHSIPTGVLGVARYADGASPLAVWVPQLGTRRVPESLYGLAAGRARILFIWPHSLGEPAPEEDWLRANAVVVRDTWMDRIKLVEFRPKEAAAF
jgi:hypothetical protein